jgi:hypothetical protein
MIGAFASAVDAESAATSLADGLIRVRSPNSQTERVGNETGVGNELIGWRDEGAVRADGFDTTER